MTPSSPAEWIAFEAAAWRRAQLERGLRAENVPSVFAHRRDEYIAQIIKQIASYVPSTYADNRGETQKEFRPNHV